MRMTRTRAELREIPDRKRKASPCIAGPIINDEYRPCGTIIAWGVLNCRLSSARAGPNSPSIPARKQDGSHERGPCPGAADAVLRVARGACRLLARLYRHRTDERPDQRFVPDRLLLHARSL